MIAPKHKVSGVWRTGIPQRKGKKLPSEIRQQVSSEASMSMSDEALKTAEIETIIKHMETLIRDAFNEGFTEGMKEFSSNRGGYSWNESRAKKLVAAHSVAEDRS